MAGLAGLVIGMGVVGSVTFRPAQPAVRVVSGGTAGPIDAESVTKAGPEEGMLRTFPTEHVDLEVADNLLLRLKPGTTVTWQQMSRPWFDRRPQIVVNLLRGELLARTRESFWGSRLEVRTPTANALVKGTAFGMQVDPSADATELKVLAGSVFFSPHLRAVGVEVPGGHRSRIQSERLPGLPEKLTAQEKEQLLDAYRIGQDPQVALVIGSGPERVKELLEPALLYVSPRIHPQLHIFLRKSIHRMNAAILQGNPRQASADLRIVEMALEHIQEPQIAVPMRLYVGAYLTRIGNPIRGMEHFQQVAQGHPHDPAASVGWAAVATTLEKLRNYETAGKLFERVLSRYPKSPEAIIAREFLRRHPSRPTKIPATAASR